MESDESKRKSIWQKTKRSSKAGFDRLWGYSDKYIGAPVNRLSNKLGSEAFWPTTLDKESDKAARILRSFCKDGFYAEEMAESADGPQGKQKVVKKIPMDVIQRAKGLAIFTTMRTGLWFSGAGGSGILVARGEDGTWSPPSGIMLHTAGLGFLVGVDIYDCVLVLNTNEAVNAFSKWRATIGGEMSAVAGPVGMGGILETEVHARQAPVFTYLKSRGFYAGVQIDGTVIIERTDENERFYGEKLSTAEIVSGKVRYRPDGLKALMETLKAAEGSDDVDESALLNDPAPADYEIVASDQMFGVPDKEDPDPYGVLALEREGLFIKVAGTDARPPEEEFEFRPSVTSPVYPVYNRPSFESSSPRSSWRKSTLSNTDRQSTYSNVHSGANRNYVTSDTATQTELDDPHVGALTVSPVEDLRASARPSPTIEEVDENEGQKPAAKTKTPPPLPPRKPKESVTVDEEPQQNSELAESSPTSPTIFVDSTEEQKKEPSEPEKADLDASKEMNTDAVPDAHLPTSKVEAEDKGKDHDISESKEDHADDDLDDELDDDLDDDLPEEEPVVHVVQQAAPPQTINKARVVQVQKRLTPQLPPRNPSRMRASGVPSGQSDAGSQEELSRPASTAESTTNENEVAPSVPSSPEKETHSNKSGSSQEEPQVSPPTTPARSPSFRSVKSEMEAENKDDQLHPVVTETQANVDKTDTTHSVSTIAIGETEQMSTATTLNEKLDQVSLKDPASDSSALPDNAQAKTEMETPSTPPAAPATHLSMANIRRGLDSDDDD